ncbi:helix-turn-helix domain-containing protein [Herbaspirillum sp. alder98]|uniref:helix-turn-helix domain-containing protein n=1 Tax=Herbaspirillum sp. alder98 TaxID=2913096 RepID=UPI001CD8990B|nr:helix-turn-helix transcriptional regulator [Herbaspirillum sp. alder98]MCA1322540.1 helix-turn-helix transcriptional regulator [Herbaspirillum sp. alder98]
MNALTKFQTIAGPDGNPLFVVVPYDEFIQRYCNSEELIPHEVIEASVVHGATPIKAWREHLRLTQGDVAQRLGISQPAYAKQENSARLRPATLARIARALGLSLAQLDF